MEDRPDYMYSYISTNINSTFFYDEQPVFVNKEVSAYIIIDSIRQSIVDQYTYQFGAKPHQNILETLVNGFVLFNLHKNRYMLESKNALIKYLNDKSISIEEKTYFLDIVLYNQMPTFLTSDEHEYLRAGGYEDYL